MRDNGPRCHKCDREAAVTIRASWRGHRQAAELPACGVHAAPTWDELREAGWTIDSERVLL